MASGSNGAGSVKQGKAGKGKPSAAKQRKGRYKPDFSKLSPDTDVPF
jgi:hypothetical protein